MSEQMLDLGSLPGLQDLFSRMIAGRHVGRVHDSQLWASLEANEEQFAALFRALGFELRIDSRGFAWLETPGRDQAIAVKIRAVAFVLLLIFEHQASAGLSLEDFEAWVIDHHMLRQVLLSHQEMLETEGLTNVGDLVSVLKSAARYGFARHDDDHWFLLAACRRFTDVFEELGEEAAADANDEAGEPA